MTNLYRKKADIYKWLYINGIENYTIIFSKKYGFVVNVNTEVDLSYKKLDFIPVKFNRIKGNFICANNNLSSLEFCPKYIEGNFDCHDNNLTSLKFSPKHVRDNYYCGNNKLISLRYAPKKINRGLYCHNNEINSFKFCPKWIHKDFNCINNNLTSLKFCPKYIGGHFSCGKNNIDSFEFLPEDVKDKVYFNENLKLGEMQKVNDFNIIQNEHLKIAKEKYFKRLNRLFKEKSKKNYLVKI